MINLCIDDVLYCVGLQDQFRHFWMKTKQQARDMCNSSDTILMVRPANFFQNPQTIADNAFQAQIAEHLSSEQIHQRAVHQFDEYVSLLRTHGVHVIVVQDTQDPIKPDAIFPNNWFTTHKEHILIYPLMSAKRRPERTIPVLDTLKNQGFAFPKIFDFSARQEGKEIVEGTGSMVLDHQNRIAYACLSERTTEKLFIEIAKDYYKYEPVYFTAYDDHGKLIYHTNVMLSVCSDFVIVCLDAITNEQERKLVQNKILESKKGSSGKPKELINLTMNQVKNFCGNVLEVMNKQGQKIMTMSQTAHQAFTKQQLQTMNKYVAKIIVADVKTIETYGGGGTRCMMAEIFLANAPK